MVKRLGKYNLLFSLFLLGGVGVFNLTGNISITLKSKVTSTFQKL